MGWFVRLSAKTAKNKNYIIYLKIKNIFDGITFFGNLVECHKSFKSLQVNMLNRLCDISGIIFSLKIHLTLGTLIMIKLYCGAFLQQTCSRNIYSSVFIASCLLISKHPPIPEATKSCLFVP